MRYLDKKFSTPANSKAYVDNWDAVFGEKRETEKTDDDPIAKFRTKRVDGVPFDI